jgi:hypothetical protein
MDILLFLLALTLGFVLYPAWQLLRVEPRRARVRSAPVSRIATIDARLDAGAAKRTRRLEWITLPELKAIAESTGDLLVVDLRNDHHCAPLPALGAQVMPVKAGDLEEFLQWLPENRAAAFCGASGLSIFIIESHLCLRGTSPLYVLEDRISSTEAA